MALLMDVWWETRPVWVRLPDLWDAMDQVDPTSGKKVDLCIKRNDQHFLVGFCFREALFWLRRTLIKVFNCHIILGSQPSISN